MNPDPMNKKNIIRLLVLAAASGVAHGATTYTNQVLVRFDGSVSGSSYTLGTGEVDTTGSFKANGTPTINLGTASLDGGTSNDGFDFNPTSLGALTTQNWVAEAILSFDTFQTGQRTIIDVQGDTDIRVNNNGNGLEALYWDGSTTNPVLTASLPSTGTFIHYALVWDAATTSLTAYIDGVSIGTSDHGTFATPDTSNVSFGYFGRATFDDRSIDGSLDAVAFSTFTGTFDPGSDFTIPEPSALWLAGLGLLPLLRRRR